MPEFPRVKQPKYTAEAQLIIPDPKNGCKHKQPKTVEKFQTISLFTKPSNNNNSSCSSEQI